MHEWASLQDEFGRCRLASVQGSNRARGLVLFRDRRRHGDDGQIKLPRIEAGSGGTPVTRAELEVAGSGPVGHHADDVGEVSDRRRARRLSVGTSTRSRDASAVTGAVP